MFDFFVRRRQEREQQLAALQTVAEALREAAADRRAEALRTEALLNELRQQRVQDQEAFLATLRSLGEQNAKIVEGVTGAVAAQANALSEHLSLFKTASAPVGRTVRDADEFAAERARLTDLNLPEEEIAALLQLEAGLLTDIDLGQ